MRCKGGSLHAKREGCAKARLLFFFVPFAPFAPFAPSRFQIDRSQTR